MRGCDEPVGHGTPVDQRRADTSNEHLLEQVSRRGRLAATRDGVRVRARVCACVRVRGACEAVSHADNGLPAPRCPLTDSIIAFI